MEDLICPQHKEEIVFLCLECNSNTKLGCYKCLAYFHRKCENIILIEDITKKNLSPILEIPKVKEHPKYSALKTLANLASKKSITEEIENMFTTLLDHFASNLSEVKDHMVKNLNPEFSIKVVSDNLFEIISLKNIEEKLGNSNFEEIEKEVAKIRLNTNSKEIKNNQGRVNNFGQSLGFPQSSNLVQLLSNPIAISNYQVNSDFEINLSKQSKDQFAAFKNEIMIGKAMENLNEIKNRITAVIEELFSFKIKNNYLFINKSTNAINF